MLDLPDPQPDPQAAKRSNFISRDVAAAQAVLAAFEQFGALRREYDRTAYAKVITQEDAVGENSHITPDIIARGFAAYDALEAVLNAGLWADLYNLLP